MSKMTFHKCIEEMSRGRIRESDVILGVVGNNQALERFDYIVREKMGISGCVTSIFSYEDLPCLRGNFYKSLFIIYNKDGYIKSYTIKEVGE